ncbi:MAG: hypothetical protein M0Z79_02725 [Nitrospiraceae bacterium]|nr:hypothetical protein [Nitrospiraceae bacterium]
MRNYYQCIIPRMDGESIEKDFPRHRGLVRKGIGGFILFGGKLSTVRRHIRLLQEEAPHPLIIASDLERGLGQQLRGGTDFPPAMALTSAVAGAGTGSIKKKALSALRTSFAAVAEEAAYAGINTIFAPVLDINTNRGNPIIATRSFGEDKETVSFMGCEMVRVFGEYGVASCGKHFPGHGDTEVDSHIRLPSVSRSLGALVRRELTPFRRAMEAGAPMIMLAHMSVPALDPSGVPVSLSEKAVSYIRDTMRYNGILITDAMNMGGIGRYVEEKACLMALRAGVDLILHPTDVEKVVSYMKKAEPKVDVSRIDTFRQSLLTGSRQRPDFALHKTISDELVRRSISATGLRSLRRPFLVILNDDKEDRGGVLIKRLRKDIPGLGHLALNQGEEMNGCTPPQGADVVVAVFSETRGWKGGASAWLFRAMAGLDYRNSVFVSFGSPYILDPIKKAAKVFAYWHSGTAQEAVADIIIKKTAAEKAHDLPPFLR